MSHPWGCGLCTGNYRGLAWSLGCYLDSPSAFFSENLFELIQVSEYKKLISEVNMKSTDAKKDTDYNIA